MASQLLTKYPIPFRNYKILKTQQPTKADEKPYWETFKTKNMGITGEIIWVLLMQSMFTRQSSHAQSCYCGHKNKRNGYVIHSTVWERKTGKHKYYVMWLVLLSQVSTSFDSGMKPAMANLDWENQRLHKKWFLNWRLLDRNEGKQCSEKSIYKVLQ